jgi:F-type H+-transporting ATPase subunit gamma
VETLDSLRRRIESANDLFGIVRTMKALSAASIRQFERAVEAVEVYNRAIEAGLRVVLQDQETAAERPARSPGGVGVIVFGSDQGMCGQFNEQIVAFSLHDVAERLGVKEQVFTLVVGMRAAARLQEADAPFEDILPVPSSVDGINPSVQALLLRINAWREEHAIERVVLYYNHPTSGAAYRSTAVQLMPVDLSRFQGPVSEVCAGRSLPMYTLDRGQLLSALVRQYLFVQLYRAYADSLASENASRLVTMQTAEKNIEERLGELNKAYHGQRQNAITSELLDIVAGSEVLGQ